MALGLGQGRGRGRGTPTLREPRLVALWIQVRCKVQARVLLVFL